MLDKTIDSALLALRRQIIREGQEGLVEVETLLRLRGVSMLKVLPPKRKDVAGKGAMRLILLEGIGRGYRSQRTLTAYVMQRRPELSREDAYTRTSLALAKMRKAGQARCEAGVWRVLDA